MKLFEDNNRKNGKHPLPISHLPRQHLTFAGEPVKHQFVKEALAGLAAAEVDKLAETKGEDWVREHKQKTKERAIQQSQELYDSQYGNGNDYNPCVSPATLPPCNEANRLQTRAGPSQPL